MTKLECVKSGSRGSRRRRLRGPSLRLGLLSGLGLVSRALLVPATPSMISLVATTTSLTITLLLFEGWLIWSTLNSTQLLSLVLRGFSSLFLFPCKADGLVHVGNIQRLDTLLLAEDLGEAIKGTWEFRHDQHCLEVVRYLKPGHVILGKVSRHLVDCNGGAFVVIHLDV